MIAKTIDRLQHLCNIIPDLLEKIPDDDFSKKPEPDKWSKKEILGHLIDSASNNHQRFIRALYENRPEISYDQNEWNRLSRHNELENSFIIQFWATYNRFILHLMRGMSEEQLNMEVQIHEKVLSLDFIINDYVVHLEHHLKQLVEY